MSKLADHYSRSTAEVALAAAEAGWATTLRFLLLRVVERPIPGLVAAAASSAVIVWIRVQW